MKKLIDKIGYETFWGGIFGIVAIIAAIVSTVLGGLDGSTIWGCVKDVAGTIVAVMVLWVAVKQIIPTKITDINKIFKIELEKIVDKYKPLIKQNTDKANKYDIAYNVEALFGNEPKSPTKIFEYDENKKLKFFVTKTFFMGKSPEDFKEMQKAIIGQILLKFDDKKKYEITVNGDTISINFNEPLNTPEDVRYAVGLIDKFLFYAIALNKKVAK